MTPTTPSRPFPFPPQDPASEPALAVEVDRLRQALRQQPPGELARRAGGTYLPGTSGGMLVINLWGAPVTLDFPGLIASQEPRGALPLPFQALMAYYLTTSDGSLPSGEWVSFADLDGGRTYAQAFQGYSGNRLVQAFGEDIAALRQACVSAGGSPFALGDAAYTFPALPRVPLLVTYWLGEEEFPSASKVLFDRFATRHLPIDVCAILGSMLVSRILKHARGSA